VTPGAGRRELDLTLVFPERESTTRAFLSRLAGMAAVPLPPRPSAFGSGQEAAALVPQERRSDGAAFSSTAMDASADEGGHQSFAILGR
jgi:hypothetical protein